MYNNKVSRRVQKPGKKFRLKTPLLDTLIVNRQFVGRQNRGWIDNRLPNAPGISLAWRALRQKAWILDSSASMSPRIIVCIAASTRQRKMIFALRKNRAWIVLLAPLHFHHTLFCSPNVAVTCRESHGEPGGFPVKSTGWFGSISSLHVRIDAKGTRPLWRPASGGSRNRWC